MADEVKLPEPLVYIKTDFKGKVDKPLPSYATPDAAGADIRADLEEDKAIVIEPGKRALIPTGLYMVIPKGWEGQIRSRSGLAVKNGVVVLNSPGTVDSDYRGEVKVVLANLGDDTFRVLDGDRIAQLVIAPAHQAIMYKVPELDNGTVRGAGGFGSTGTN